MITRLLLFVLNGYIWLKNGWRRLWRRIRRWRADYVAMELHGSLPEIGSTPSRLQRWLGAEGSVGLHELRSRFQRIAAERQLRGVVLLVRALKPGWNSAAMLRRELLALREQGKQVIVYLPEADTRSYLAVCAADVLIMPPTASLNLVGIAAEALFFRDALNLVGIEAEVTAVSPYKAGGDMFTRTDLSPESREQLERLLDQRYAMLVATIASDRSLSDTQVRALIDSAPYFAPAARDQGLIDAVLYEDELKPFLSKRLARQQARNTPGTPTNPEAEHTPAARFVAWQTAHGILALPYRRSLRPRIGIVNITGTLTSGEESPKPLPLPGGDQAASDSIIRALQKAEQTPGLAALIIRIDSPGGDAFASDLIWREVARIRRRKPVVVSMGSVAASGGYYIAAAASTIVAHPGTITGSIGVFTLRPNASSLLQRLGITVTTLNRGARASLLNLAAPPSDDERTWLRETVFQTYATFTQRVCAGRNLSAAALEPLAGGRVWTGSEARQHGLVDVLGGLPEAVAQAQTLANLPPDPLAPLLTVKPGRRGTRHLPPAFPTTPPPRPPESALLATLPAPLAELLRVRVLALLPWVWREW